ncbi:MAG: hypothetical protein M3M99_05120 [Actinomycetota bacterium]|nr:hypothetical protein [Actinomycetota bacterium]
MRTPPHPKIALHSPASRHGNTSRLRLLADAVREHERAAAEAGFAPRQRDEELYRRLRGIEGSLPLAD